MRRLRCTSWGAILCCCVIAFALPARAATSMFLKVDGIQGESKDIAHPSQIEVMSFNTGVTQTVTMQAGMGGAAGKAQIEPFVVSKAVDTSSPHLFTAACNGKHIPSVVLDVVAAGEKPLTILRYTLNDVIVSSVQTSAAGGADRPMEQVSFAFAKINIEYMGQSDKGGAGAKSVGGWDLKTNKAASTGGAASPDGSAAAAATAAPDAGGAAAAGGAPAGAAAAGGAAPAAGGAAGGAAPAGAAPAAAGDPAAAQPAVGSKPLTRAQRERLKVQQGTPVAPAPAK